MKTYYITFKKDCKPVCGCFKKAKNPDEAMLAAEFALICKHPAVVYDDLEAAECDV